MSESDPWFEQGASASLFSSRFRNFVVARCRSQGLNLSADELDLVDAWFSSQVQSQPVNYGRAAPAQQPAPAAQASAPVAPQNERWWSLEEGRQHIAEQRSQEGSYSAADERRRISAHRAAGVARLSAHDQLSCKTPGTARPGRFCLRAFAYCAVTVIRSVSA